MTKTRRTTEASRKEATVWVDGLDRIDKQRGINFCIDLRATPYFLGRAGQTTNTVFPWVVSDFGLTDAIESRPGENSAARARDASGARCRRYFNIWRWIMRKLTAAERGGKRGNPKPEAVLQIRRITPIAILGGTVGRDAQGVGRTDDEKRPPVFILVCKNTTYCAG